MQKEYFNPYCYSRKIPASIAYGNISKAILFVAEALLLQQAVKLSLASFGRSMGCICIIM